MSRVSLDTSRRLMMDIPEPVNTRLLRAAALERKSLRDFMLSKAIEAADLVIENSERVVLSERDTHKLMDLLDNPREANPNMVAVLKARKTS